MRNAQECREIREMAYLLSGADEWSQDDIHEELIRLARAAQVEALEWAEQSIAPKSVVYTAARAGTIASLVQPIRAKIAEIKAGGMETN